MLWVKLTDEAFPRLSTVRSVKPDGASYLGPFSSARLAERATAAVHEAFPLRQCRSRLTSRGGGSACALYEMGRCHAPCELRESAADYAVHVEAVRLAMNGDARAIVAALTRRITRLAEAGRYEDAAVHRDRLAAFLRAADRLQRLTALTGCAEMVAARPTPDGAWELAVIRHGRLAAAGLAERGVDPRPLATALGGSAEVVAPGFGPIPAATAEETECVLRWLDQPGTRLVSIDGTWSCPAYGAGGLREMVDVADDARLLTRPFDDRRGLRPGHRPSATASRIAG
jgi:DNA polymerase-3 subunit epsilon